MNQLSTEKRAAVIAALVEGNSLRGTARLTGVARMTIEKLLRDLGAACAEYHDANVRGLKSQRIQCDEIWSFVGAKARNATPEQKAHGWGDCWTWTAIDADSKLIVAYALGPRRPETAYDFMQDVASRLTNRVQMTTDSLRVYLNAVEFAFGSQVDYAMLEKYYARAFGVNAASRYSPPKMTSMKAATISGTPDRRHISTSFVERQNLTMRMHMRRFGRLTNAFSKKVEMHAHAVALHFMHYNFCRIHQTLRVTPAMEAGLADHPWELSELVTLLQQAPTALAG